MSQPQESGNPDFVSKVSFFPVEDRTGENKALIVTIKRVVPEEGDEFYRRMEPPRRSLSMDSRKKRTSSRTSSDKSKSRGTMTENPTSTSFSTQTSVELSSPNTSDAAHGSSPCLKHAAENIANRASRVPSEKVSLCNNCSKSMLSYIFVVQDFLDSLAREIIGDTDSKNCVQCLRQENRLSVTSQPKENVSKTERKTSKTRAKSADPHHKSESSSKMDDSGKSTVAKEGPRDTRRYEETAERLIKRSISEHLQDHHRDAHDSTQQHNSGPQNTEELKGSLQTYNQGEQRDQQQGQYQNQSASNDYQGHGIQQDRHQAHPVLSHQEGSVHPQITIQDSRYHGASEDQMPPVQQHEQMSSYQVDSQAASYPSDERRTFRKPMERQQPNFDENAFHREENGGGGSNGNGFHNADTMPSPSIDGANSFMPTLSNVDREVYDAARNGAGWESLSESQERISTSSTSRITSEAFVTMCRNNAEALGCLVVGTSLLLCRTSRTLCVVVSDGVSNAFRGPLSSVFHVVQCVRSLDSLGTTKLALLEQPDLGISFEKLNVWRLIQFNKCVYLNPDTLVIKNCDELFCHEELSAVPDIGWPDCFNSGVFTFVPSIQTFWQLLEFAEKQGSYDGGDQGLLNSYFNNWSDDINKKLSFIYNLMANVSYTYTPAYKQFGRNVKIVQFHGSFKPWHVKFFSSTGQINPATPVHPTYVQFVYIWIKIFRLSALKQLTQEIQSYALSQEVYCAVELLRFFPLPTESEVEFFLTPPSVRLRLAERKLQKPWKVSEDVQRRKSAEYTPLRDSDIESPEGAAEVSSTSDEPSAKPAAGETKAAEADEGKEAAVGGTTVDETDASAQDEQKEPAKSLLPGAEVGNYQGMKAWEQGRMDYQGTDSSDTIIKRLEFLMSQPK